jgi:hypothetical protein
MILTDERRNSGTHMRPVLGNGAVNPCRHERKTRNKSKSKSHYDDSLGVRRPSGTRDQFFFRQLRHCFFVAPSLTRGQVCNLLVELLPGLARAVTLGSKSRRTHGHILLPHLRLPQPGGPGSRIYIPQEQCGPVIPPGTGYWLTIDWYWQKTDPTSRQRGQARAGLRWRESAATLNYRLLIKLQTCNGLNKISRRKKNCSQVPDGCPTPGQTGLLTVGRKLTSTPTSRLGKADYALVTISLRYRHATIEDAMLYMRSLLGNSAACADVM